MPRHILCTVIELPGSRFPFSCSCSASRYTWLNREANDAFCIVKNESGTAHQNHQSHQWCTTLFLLLPFIPLLIAALWRAANLPCYGAFLFYETFVSIFHPCDRDYVMDATNSIAECFKTIQPYDQTFDDRVALLKCAVIDIIIARIVRTTVFLSLSSWFVKEIKCRKNASCLFNAPLKSLIIFKKRDNICHLSVFQAS